MRLFRMLSLFIGIQALIISGCGGGGGGVGGGDTTMPVVSIASPSNSATVSGTVTVSATASDNIGVSQVEFYINGVLKTTVATVPFNFSWDTSSLKNDIYTLTAKAYDAAGNVGQSGTAQVTVSNPVGKTATLVLTSLSSTIPPPQIGGFDLAVDLSALPPGGAIKTDISGTPTSASVILTGKFTGATFGQFSVVSYDSNTRILTINYPTANSYPLGEFLTITCDVPTSYTPNVNDVHYSSTFYEPLTGNVLNSVSVSATFN